MKLACKIERVALKKSNKNKTKKYFQVLEILFYYMKSQFFNIKKKNIEKCLEIILPNLSPFY
jgi:hypothetical protein